MVHSIHHIPIIEVITTTDVLGIVILGRWVSLDPSDTAYCVNGFNSAALLNAR